MPTPCLTSPFPQPQLPLPFPVRPRVAADSQVLLPFDARLSAAFVPSGFDRTEQVFVERQFAQIKVTPHDIEANLKRMLETIAQARRDGADIVVFPAHALLGYYIGDRSENPRLFDMLDDAHEKLRMAVDGHGQPALFWQGFQNLTGQGPLHAGLSLTPAKHFGRQK